MPSTQKRWDIFCSVVDNFGDIGVAWRLARQLASEHAIAVRLFVDDLSSLRRIAPQDATGVNVCQWHGPSSNISTADLAPPDAVIEAFGCGLPARVLDAMGALPTQPRWINLEYLSAEAWVEGSHRLASPQPRRPLTRYFYFPGFTSRTGGLLREHDLFARRDAFRLDAAARSTLWRRLGIDAPVPGTLAISLFCYPNAELAPLLDAWAVGEAPILCVVPEGVVPAELAAWVGSAMRWPERPFRRGSLTLAVVPFVPQDDYDRVLWACDLNFVRGEDSFVRAQWAARPLVWHCYPQSGNAHWPKLDAFASRYAAALPADVASAYAGVATAWNGRAPLGHAWTSLYGALPTLTAHAQTWAASLAAIPDLASGLVEFVEKRV
jgi:uncharacterized repeat protein (TIGR03837 family)